MSSFKEGDTVFIPFVDMGSDDSPVEIKTEEAKILQVDGEFGVIVVDRPIMSKNSKRVFERSEIKDLYSTEGEAIRAVNSSSHTRIVNLKSMIQGHLDTIEAAKHQLEDMGLE